MKKDASRIFVWLEIIVGVLTLLYWAMFFFVPGSVQSSSERCYLVFERSFVAADVWMSIAFFLSAYYLLKKDVKGVLWGIVAGGTFVYLGCMDILYNLENGMYMHINAGMAGEIIINLASVIFGGITINYMWSFMKAEENKKTL